ncbi:MAG: FAD binding domain-containing protein [Gemmatimonadota bacterium]|nr:FAD binding domain-containing protein [Gemmatimonadota bacterium]MDH3421810.1 FAD binding domain-containing protein [Gemmatimonadota bacterium]
MKTFANRNARSVQEAVQLAQSARADGQSVSFAGGGTDLLQLVKDRVPNRPGSPAPDVLINLKTIPGMDSIEGGSGGGLTVGGLVSLSALASDVRVRQRFAVLAEAAESVGTPQIRNVGTVAGNLVQRPWCWYYRNGFPCYKAGGNRCFSIAGENQLHAIFGGGPSYIVHPSDLAPAMVALGASFRVVGPGGERVLPAADFFVSPRVDAEHENVLTDDEVLASVEIQAQPSSVRSTYHKVMDREAWTHALVSAAVVLDMSGDVCRQARIVLGGVAPVPWRVAEAERLLAGQRITAELAAQVAAAAVAGARPLAKNAYKVPLTRGVVERTLVALAG